MIGNTHFDPAWLWTWDEAMASIRATFISALERMNEDPDFRYSFSTPAVFEWIENTDPELFSQIQSRVKEGRWDVGAEAWWLQPDCNLPRGESLIRQGLYGQLYLMEKFGAKVEKTENAVTVSGGNLTGCEIDIDKTPDLIAPLGVIAAYAKGKTVFYNGARLRIKESDRIETMKNLILSLGGQAEETEDTLTVYGGGTLSGGTVDGANDHRIVMAAAIAGSASESGARILGAEAVSKSYPGFFEDFNSTGGNANVI